MRRARAVVAWLLLVPVGGALLGLGLMLAAPGAVLILAGLMLWVAADRLLARPRRAHWDDNQWRAYLAHPSTIGMAQRKIRGEE